MRKIVSVTAKNIMLENRSAADSHIITYRPDIDGLRAIAVISVIIYHLSHAILPRGYLGVDVFFVLSGYLITAIIWREIAVGDFSLLRFYERRIRRILPALLAMIFITTVAATLLLLPVDLIGFARSLFATLGFVANVYFWRDTNYFSGIADEKPLLHLWSLGIEEQFYLIFPLLLILLARKGKAWTLLSMAGLCIASFAINVLALKSDAYLPAFYLLPTRAWELGVGALIALLPPKTISAPKIMAIYGYLGALLLVISLAAGQRLNLLSIPESALIVTATALIIYSGTQGGHLVNRWLASPGLVFLGLISYSLYLWHWPILVLLKYYLVRNLTLSESGLAFCIMVALAILSWRFIERPFRGSKISSKSVRYAALAGMILPGMAAAAIIAQSGFPQRLNPAAAQINAAVGSNYRCAVADYLYFEQSRACVLQLPSRAPNDADIVLFGNSHALMYAPVLREIIHDASLSGLLVSENGCLPTYDVNISPACAVLTNRNIEAILKLERARIVVIGTTWSRFVTGEGKHAPRTAETMRDGLDRTIDRFIAAGKKVVLIGPLATPKWNVASIVGRNLAFGRATERPLYAPAQDFQTAYSGVIAHFARRRDIVFARPDLVQCREGRCDYLIDGRALFADGNHLAAAELALFRPALEAAVKQALPGP